MKNTANNIRRAALVAALCIAAAQAAFAQTRDPFAPADAIRRVAVGPPISSAVGGTCPCCDTNCGGFASLDEASDGSFSLTVRAIDRPTGLRRGNDLTITMTEGVRPVDLMFSRIVSPGSLLVLDAARRIHVFSLSFDPETGTPALDGSPSVLGPFGNPDTSGEATALAEAPNPADPNSSYLAVGTRTGGIIAILIGARNLEPVEVPISTSPVDDLATVPQVGYFAFAAVAGGRLIGVDPDANPRLSGPQPEVKFSYGGGQWSGFALKDIGADNIEPTDVPLVEPAPVRVVAANGTPEVRILYIPTDPSLDGLLRITEGVNRVVVDIAEVEMGSLVMLSADGAGLFYQPGFTLDAGFSGPTLTLAGSTMTFSPQTLNLRSRGQYVTLAFEVENNGAAEIDASTLMLGVEGADGFVPASFDYAPQLDDADGNGLEDLTVKFDRESVAALLRQTPTDTPLVRVRWSAASGQRGAASARIRVKR